MTLRDHSITMRQMLDNARLAIKHANGKSLDDVLNDELLGLALIRLVEVVGEAATRVPSETRVLYPHVQWRQAIDTRNRVIHGYDTVDLSVIFGIIQHNFPPLVAELERILESEAGTDDSSTN